MKKCMYCKVKLQEENVVEICQKCGINVFGGKLFKAIIQNMETAREKGDLYQGSIINESFEDNPLPVNTKLLN